jgi:hypothetical protein
VQVSEELELPELGLEDSEPSGGGSPPTPSAPSSLPLGIGFIASDPYFPVLTDSAPKSESFVIWFGVSFL